MSDEDDDLDTLIATHYRRWTCLVWRDAGCLGVKLGPLTVFSYRWENSQRVCVTFNAGPERVLFSLPLASAN